MCLIGPYLLFMTDSELDWINVDLWDIYYDHEILEKFNKDNLSNVGNNRLDPSLYIPKKGCDAVDENVLN